MTDDASTAPEDAGLAALLASMLRDAERLVMQELALFQTEVGENASRLATSAALFAAGFAIALIGGLGILAAVILVLGKIMPLWVASALTGVAIFSAGAVLALSARHRLLQASLVPHRSLDAVRDTANWLKQELT